MRRLTILLATVGALLLVPAASAFAGTLTVEITGTGSGEVVDNYAFGGIAAGSPPLECSYASPGPQSGTCENEPQEEEGYPEDILNVFPAPGSELSEFVIEEGEGFTSNPKIGGLAPCTAESVKENPTGQCAVWNETPGSTIAIFVVFEAEEGPPANPNLKLNVEEGEGTVVSNPAGLTCSKAAPGSCEAEVAEGKVTLTASPAPGYAFKSWKGCDAGGAVGRQCTVTATSSLKSVGAKFYKVWNLKISKNNPNGSASTSPGGVNCGTGCLSSAADYKPGSLTLKAKPAKNFHFVEFVGGTGSASSCNGSESLECTITLGANSTITEFYAENAKKTLTLTKSGGGQGFIKTKPTNVNCGYTCGSATAEFFAAETAVPVTVALNKGTTSVTWSGGTGGTTCTANQLSCTIDMSSAQSLTAEFK